MINDDPSTSHIPSAITKTGEDLLNAIPQEKQPSNPALITYYKNKARLDSIKYWLSIIFPILAAIALSLLGYYFVSIREPLIRLEEAVKTLKEVVNNHTVTIEGFKKFMYSNDQNSFPSQNTIPDNKQK